jgi:hypothetical protein
VVLETDLPRLERPRLLLGLIDVLPLGVDLLVYTPEEFAKGLRDRYGVFDAIPAVTRSRPRRRRSRPFTTCAARAS